jgi:succinate dehydrogenase/fumarate reductase flavoprotein subunit
MVAAHGDTEFDMVVVGSGAAGLTAATVAALDGLRVLVIEKTERIGGTSAISGGAIWIPNNHHIAEIGLEDSRENGEIYLKNVLGNYYDDKKISAFLTYGSEMLKYLEAKTEVRYFTGPYGDYEPEKPGAAKGRTCGAEVFDGRRLGKDLQLVRPALPQLGAFNGMQIAVTDIAAFSTVLRNPRSFLYSAGKFVRYVIDRVFHGQATRMVNGNALVGRLFLSAKNAGVTIWTSSQMLETVEEKGRVCGVRVLQRGAEVTVLARFGVVLASGGYGANSEMQRVNIPDAEFGWSLQPEGSQGDGIRAGQQAGGQFISQNIDNANYSPISTMIDRNGNRINYPHIMWDRHNPGFIVVDKSGKRFVNESSSYQAFGKAMIDKQVRSAWLVGTRHAIRRYSMGLAKATPLPIRPYIKNGYLKMSSTLAGLADELGLPKADFLETVEMFNSYAKSGVDPDFHRGGDAYSASMGDPTHQPNPTLGELEKGPFYAVELFLGRLCTMNGLETDHHARVLNESKVPIDGLYAVGLDANAVFRGAYPGGGASLGPAMTFGYIAARHVAGRR